jgi:hypothetical protein
MLHTSLIAAVHLIEWLAESTLGLAVITVVSTQLFYWFYVFGMNVLYSYRQGNFKGRWWLTADFLPLAALFLVFDVLFNTVFGTLFFLELPRWKGPVADWEIMFTARVTRWMVVIPQGRRARFARFVCKNMLNPLAIVPQHCTPDPAADAVAEKSPAVG